MGRAPPAAANPHPDGYRRLDLSLRERCSLRLSPLAAWPAKRSAMPDLLLELFSEEIPARMQRRAAEDLRKLVTDALVERGFVYEAAVAYATPRRLALHVVGL